ncbi:hypothetical protein [Nocardia neocaledoniensis]|uniref:hypothetical protein n=1 Tax=Nocardia neocaledoniensis TaxID=236511 RepID=UPI0024551D38|nr:hypothetical protein [Nocardia neocaledoniensis]
MARYTTMRPTLDDAVREILTTSETLPLPSPRRTGAPDPGASYPVTRRRATGSAIRCAQTRSTTVRKPLRIPGR